MSDNNRLKLKSLYVKGFKSINNEGENIEFNDITVLLGANGAGKSNLVSFFSLINYMTSGGLQNWVAKNGFANSILFYGVKNTTRIEASLRFESDNIEDEYEFILSHAAGDNMIITEEKVTYRKKNNPTPYVKTLDFGVKESTLSTKLESTKENKPIIVLSRILRSCRVFQFHDTSLTAHVRNKSYIEDNRYLKSDGGNLSAFLYNLQMNFPKYYDRIVRHLNSVIPQFKNFALRPSTGNDKYIGLDWISYNDDYLLGPHQISDGSIRFMCLSTLLLQPKELMPSVIIIDEPELGLHPSAISKLSGMIKIASKNSQIILATQSPNLVDNFSLDDIIVVERNPDDGSSNFKKLDEDKLSQWLDEYTLSELWEKNVIGGQPA